MNYKQACRVLYLDETKKHDFKTIKKSYHALALRYHPDKNKDEDAEHIFKEVNAAYHFINNNDNIPRLDPYDAFFDYFTNSLNNRELQQEYVDAAIEKIFCVCETHSMNIIQSLEFTKFIIIYKLFKKYRHLFQFSLEFDTFMEKRMIYWFAQGSLKERRSLSKESSEDKTDLSSQYDENDEKETMVLRPLLDDVIVDNVYKYTHHGNQLLIPLWHHEMEYDISGEFAIKIMPKLPSMNFWIDTNNNLHQRVKYTISELWDCVLQKKYMEIFFGKKRFIFYPHDLELKTTQTWTWKMEGISRINHQNIYDVSRRADVVLHIEIFGII